MAHAGVDYSKWDRMAFAESDDDGTDDEVDLEADGGGDDAECKCPICTAPGQGAGASRDAPGAGPPLCLNVPASDGAPGPSSRSAMPAPSRADKTPAAEKKPAAGANGAAPQPLDYSKWDRMALECDSDEEYADDPLPELDQKGIQQAMDAALQDGETFVAPATPQAQPPGTSAARRESEKPSKPQPAPPASDPAPVAKGSTVRHAPVDYSKWDALEESDDEPTSPTDEVFDQLADLDPDLDPGLEPKALTNKTSDKTGSPGEAAAAAKDSSETPAPQQPLSSSGGEEPARAAREGPPPAAGASPAPGEGDAAADTLTDALSVQHSGVDYSKWSRLDLEGDSAKEETPSEDGSSAESGSESEDWPASMFESETFEKCKRFVDEMLCLNGAATYELKLVLEALGLKTLRKLCTIVSAKLPKGLNLDAAESLVDALVSATDGPGDLLQHLPVEAREAYKACLVVFNETSPFRAGLDAFDKEFSLTKIRKRLERARRMRKAFERQCAGMGDVALEGTAGGSGAGGVGSVDDLAVDNGLGDDGEFDHDDEGDGVGSGKGRRRNYDCFSCRLPGVSVGCPKCGMAFCKFCMDSPDAAPPPLWLDYCNTTGCKEVVCLRCRRERPCERCGVALDSGFKAVLRRRRKALETAILRIEADRTEDARGSKEDRRVEMRLNKAAGITAAGDKTPPSPTRSAKAAADAVAAELMREADEEAAAAERQKAKAAKKKEKEKRRKERKRLEAKGVEAEAEAGDEDNEPEDASPEPPEVPAEVPAPSSPHPSPQKELPPPRPPPQPKAQAPAVVASPPARPPARPPAPASVPATAPAQAPTRERKKSKGDVSQEARAVSGQTPPTSQQRGAGASDAGWVPVAGRKQPVPEPQQAVTPPARNGSAPAERKPYLPPQLQRRDEASGRADSARAAAGKGNAQGARQQAAVTQAAPAPARAPVPASAPAPTPAPGKQSKPRVEQHPPSQANGGSPALLEQCRGEVLARVRTLKSAAAGRDVRILDEAIGGSQALLARAKAQFSFNGMLQEILALSAELQAAQRARERLVAGQQAPAPGRATTQADRTPLPKASTVGSAPAPPQQAADPLLQLLRGEQARPQQQPQGLQSHHHQQQQQQQARRLPQQQQQQQQHVAPSSQAPLSSQGLASHLPPHSAPSQAQAAARATPTGAFSSPLSWLPVDSPSTESAGTGSWSPWGSGSIWSSPSTHTNGSATGYPGNGGLWGMTTPLSSRSSSSFSSPYGADTSQASKAQQGASTAGTWGYGQSLQQQQQQQQQQPPPQQAATLAFASPPAGQAYAGAYPSWGVQSAPQGAARQPPPQQPSQDPAQNGGHLWT